MKGESADQNESWLATGESQSPSDSIGARDLLSRVASVVGEIEALKRERHDEGLFSTRLEFASVYFRKRGRQRGETMPKRAASAA